MCIDNRGCGCVACILQRRPDGRAPLTRCRAVDDVDDCSRQKNVETVTETAGVEKRARYQFEVLPGTNYAPKKCIASFLIENGRCGAADHPTRFFLFLDALACEIIYTLSLPPRRRLGGLQRLVCYTVTCTSPNNRTLTHSPRFEQLNRSVAVAFDALPWPRSCVEHPGLNNRHAVYKDVRNAG